MHVPDLSQSKNHGRRAQNPANENRSHFHASIILSPDFLLRHRHLTVPGLGSHPTGEPVTRSVSQLRSCESDPRSGIPPPSVPGWLPGMIALPTDVRIRDFRPDDGPRVDELAVAAFKQFEAEYEDWSAMKNALGKMADLAASGELLIADYDETILGAVVYIPPDQPKADYFDVAWPVLRMLVVDPKVRGLGIGKSLTNACIDRAKRDGCSVIALHTSPIMAVALPMYLRMGFRRIRRAPFLHGVEYAVYLKTID